MTSLHEVQPRETAGRMMIGRVNMQFQAAAFAALEILDGAGVDRVYCDYHDDFVVRKNVAGCTRFHFFQVKTSGKRNHLWSLLEVFALKKRGQGTDSASLKAIEGSFAGKLLIHSINFDDACETVTLLTNVQFNDDVEGVVSEFATAAHKTAPVTFLAGKFSEIFNGAATFEAAKVAATLQKFRLAPGVKYISGDHSEFVDAARGAIYRYSEIDLEYQEVQEIAASLISLVHRKSFAEISTGMSPERLDEAAGIAIDDLLGVLSISKEVYRALIGGEDPAALRNASIIQRRMRAAGATDSMIEYCTQQKVNWDIWLRRTRHAIPDFTLNFLLERLHAIYTGWSIPNATMDDLRQRIEALRKEKGVASIESLTDELLLGGVLSAMVRVKA